MSANYAYEAVDVNDVEMHLNWLEVKTNTEPETKPETEFTTTYPLNGKKIKRLTEQDTSIFMYNDEYFRVKVFNADNIFGVGTDPSNVTESKNSVNICIGLYQRIRVILIKKLNYTKLVLSAKELKLNGSKPFIDVFNKAIDWLENYAQFHEIDLDKLLKNDNE